MYRYLISSTLLLILSTLAFAQITVTQKQWIELESQVGWVTDPKEVLLKWKATAIKKNDDVTLARCLNQLLKIQDQRTEDSLYFKNSAFIDTLLNTSHSSPRLKAIMHVMQAQRLNSFTRYNRKFSRSTYFTPKLKNNYAALSNKQIDSLSIVHLQLALKQPEFRYDINEYRWLSSNPDAFLFEPRFKDLVLAEQVSFGARRNHYYRDTINSWLRLPSTQLRNKLATVKQFGEYETLFAYNQWVKYNEDKPAVAAFIESLVRKEIWIKTSTDTSLQSAYISYLQNCVKSNYPLLKAHAVYQLCLMWNSDGKRYADLNTYSYINFKRDVFDKKFQYYPLKALQLYEQNQALMNEYPVFNNVLKMMVLQIKSSGIRLQVNQDHVPPGKPILLTATYRNADTMYYRVIRVGAEDSKNEQAASVIQGLLKHRAISQGTFTLPAEKDYNAHAAYLKLDALPHGHYRLLFADKPLGNANVKKVHSVAFGVSKLAIINTDENVFVLDRTTGRPIQGATLKAYYQDNSDRYTETFINTPISPSNKQGSTVVPEKTSKIIATFKGDTAIVYTRVNHNIVNDDAYDADEDADDDDLIDYYDDNLKANIFTDRAIYRPGQTVHFKVLFMTKNPDTGLPMLFAPGNLKKGEKMMKEWLDQNKELILLKDAFSKVIDSAHVTINEFGSFAGSFVIPKAAATGEWNIEPQIIDEDNANRGRFKVEEYKRPTLELVLEKPKKIIKPKQVFFIQLKLRSFSGAQMGNIPIKYTITRSGRLPGNVYQRPQIADTTSYTDAEGKLNIAINDTALHKFNLADSLAWAYTYNIEAQATDPTGETVKLNGSVQANSWPVNISIPLADTYDKKDIPVFNVRTSAGYEGVVGRQVNIKLYSTNKPRLIEYGNNFQRVDQWVYPKDSLIKWFPDLLNETPPALKRQLVWETTVNTAKFGTLNILKDKISAGNYELIATTTDSGLLSGRSLYQFKVFDSQTGKIPEDKTPISYLNTTTAKPGQTVSWYTSAAADTYSVYLVNYVTGMKLPKVVTKYTTVDEKQGLRKWTYKVPKNATEDIKLSRVYVLHNQVYKEDKTIFLQKQEVFKPEIIIEKYRRVMAPGSTETFSISVKTKSDRIAAELMTTLYDASLDKLEKHYWNGINNSQYQPRINLFAHWTSSLFGTTTGGNYLPNAYYVRADTVVMYDELSSPGALQGKLAGISISSSAGLNEVVSVGYGTVRRRDITGSVASVQVRGSGSLASYNQPFIVVNGKPFDGTINDINASLISEIMVLKDAEATALYGSRAANGVLIISTQGPIILPEPEKPPVKIRKNFNETAFFFPQVHAGTDGFYTFTFIMPETATEWNWKMLAHTKDAKVAFLSRTLQTQLNLMVQPNMPRLLYQGDRINMQSRISNLAAEAATCTIICKIEDVVTGEDVTTKLTPLSSKQIKLEAKSSTAAGFMLNVPTSQQNPLKLVITVNGNGAADAEEHILPVASTRIFVRQSVPLHFANNAQLAVNAVKIPADATVYGLSLSINPKPQAALINALPWLANYPFNCAEQTFNKLRANVTALLLMRTDVTTQKAYQQALKTKGNDTATTANNLPDELAQQAMPWLNLGNKTIKSHQQLLGVLDTVTAQQAIAKHLQRLYDLQQTDGGLSWFDGGRSDAYISAYVLGNMAQLQNQGWNKLSSSTQQIAFNKFIVKLSAYNQNEVLAAKMIDATSSLSQYMLYAAGHNNQAVNGRAIALIDAAWKKLPQMGISTQALLIINTLRHTKPADPLYKKALQQLNTLRQAAIVDDQNGMRWKEISDADELSNSAEETVALLNEAFELANSRQGEQSGILKWLLTARQDEHWQTTKGTAAAINMLVKEKGGALGTTQTITANVMAQSVQVNDDLLNGTPSAFVAVSQQPQTVTVHKQGTDVHGSLTWYYFAQPQSLDTLNKGISIKRQFVHFNGHDWQPITAQTRLKPGDKVRAQLTIESGSRLKYVYINDPRAASFEPDALKSEYRYSGNMGYYQSVRDAGMQFFADVIPRGTSTITYDMIVAHEGEFAVGPATLQCMYKPNVTAYSSTGKVFVSRN